MRALRQAPAGAGERAGPPHGCNRRYGCGGARWAVPDVPFEDGMQELQIVNCRDGCGTFEEFPIGTLLEEATSRLNACGWSFLASVARWRCPGCYVRLSEVAASLAADPNFADKLDPRSRGALPRNTAVTIVPPANVAAEANSQLYWE